MQRPLWVFSPSFTGWKENTRGKERKSTHLLLQNADRQVHFEGRGVQLYIQSTQSLCTPDSLARETRSSSFSRSYIRVVVSLCFSPNAAVVSNAIFYLFTVHGKCAHI